MKEDHISMLVCPKTKRQLEFKSKTLNNNNVVKEGVLIEPVSGNEYPIVNHIPRFVPQENYADSFGFQWKTHIHTQYDSYSNVNVSAERFLKETKWKADLKGQLILEVGCGSGRFTPHALNTGATVVSFDYSNAIESSYEMNVLMGMQ